MSLDAPTRPRRNSDRQQVVVYQPDPNRVMPSSLEAEMGTLGSFLLNPIAVGGLIVERQIEETHFYVPAHAQIFVELMKMWEQRRPIDFVTLTEWLHARNLLETVGGGAMVSNLFTYVPTAMNVDYYLETLEEKAMLRRLIVSCTEHSCRAYVEGDQVVELVDSYEQSALSIRKFRRRSTPSMHELVCDVINDFQASFDRSGGISGLGTGLTDLDSAIDGLHRAEMIVIAARPSHGKTALAMRMIEHIALDLGKPVGVFSLEMSAKQLVHRLVCQMARVNYFRWRDGWRTQRDCDEISRVGDLIARAPIYIDDTSGLSIQEARAKARRWKAEFAIEALFGDYLQLFTSHTKRAAENRQLEVAEISAGCKGIAKDLDVPFVVLAQLDRGVDKQQRKPRLSDLRESGAIEQDADVVGALTREEMYAETDEERAECVGKATLDILKQRSGPLGPVALTFLKEYTRFETRIEAPEPMHEPDLIVDDPRQAKPKPSFDFSKLRTGD